jgi:hypothetical protein
MKLLNFVKEFMSLFHSMAAYSSSLTTNVLLKASNFICYKLIGLFMSRYDTFSLNLPKYIIPLVREIYLHHLKVLKRTGIGQALYAQSNIQERSRNHCCRENQKVLNVVSVCVCMCVCGVCVCVSFP